MIPPGSPSEIVNAIDRVMRQALEAVISTIAGSAKDSRYTRQQDFCSLERWAELCSLATFTTFTTFSEGDGKTEVCNIQYLNFFLLHIHFFDICSNSTYLLAGYLVRHMSFTLIKHLIGFWSVGTCFS